MVVPENSIQMLTGAHHEEIVNKLKQEIKTLQCELCKTKTAYFENLSYCAKADKKLRELGVSLDDDSIAA